LSQTPLNFLNLFVESPGDLLYFLVVIAISQAGLFMALGHRSRFPYQQSTQRYVVATFGLVGVWVLLLAGALLSLLSSQDPSLILPPLERLAYTITLLMLSWAFLSADYVQWNNRSNIILVSTIAVSVVLYIITAIQWREVSGVIPVFNLSLFAPLWSFIPTLFALAGLLIAVLNFRSIVDAPIKIVFFVLIIIGNGYNLIQFTQGQVFGNYLGSARLAYVTCLVMMPLIIYRIVVSYLENSVAEVALAASQPSAPAATIPTSSNPDSIPIPAVPSSPIETQSVQLLKAMGMMMDADETVRIPERVVHAAIDTLRVDIGVLLKIQDANYADIVVGYDRVMNRPVSGISLSLEDQPTLVNAIERRSQRALFLERNTEELDDLYRRMDIDQQGTVYIQPLTKQQELVGVLLIGMPYSQREFKSSETELLKGIGIIASNLLALSFESQEATLLAQERAIQAMVEGVSIDSIDQSDVVNARLEMEASLQLARDQISQLGGQVMQLKLQLDEEHKRVLLLLGDSNDDMSVSQRISVIFDDQEQLREERDSLAKDLLDAETALTTLTVQDDEALTQDISESLRREYDGLVATRDRLLIQIDDLRSKDKTIINAEAQTIIESMSLEKSRLESERNQLSDKLAGIQAQLSSMGIDGEVTGLAQAVAQLYSERKDLTNKMDTLRRERDTLLRERENGLPHHGVDVQQLQQHIKHLAADRETFQKLRDRMRSDYKELLSKFKTVREQKSVLQEKTKELLAEVSNSHNEQEKMNQQIHQLSDEKSSLLKARDQLLAQVDSMQAESTLDDVSDESQTTIRAQLVALQTMIKDLTEQREKLELELNYTQTALAESRNQIDQFKLTQQDDVSIESAVYTLNDPELFIGLVQELRTPMTSIAGYIDLLLGESVGILGEMQRNFLRRVSANILRLASMIDDLVKVTQLDAGTFELERTPVDLIAVIEEVITDASNQFREKELVLNLSLDDTLPSLPADEDGIRQIIGQLLTNAYLVSPSGSEISIMAQQDHIQLPSTTSPIDVILLTIEDKGGGILPEDIPRVFARKYKAENPLIEGLGDTGVGMSIAKTLIEVHNGYLWVESELGVGSSFKIALPLNTIMQVEG
jgi:signal transduction histidine kinase